MRDDHVAYLTIGVIALFILLAMTVLLYTYILFKEPKMDTNQVDDREVTATEVMELLHLREVILPWRELQYKERAIKWIVENKKEKQYLNWTYQGRDRDVVSFFEMYMCKPKDEV